MFIFVYFLFIFVYFCLFKYNRVLDHEYDPDYNPDEIDPIYTINSDAAIIMFSLASEISFGCAIGKYHDIREQFGPNFPIIFCGNMVDLESKRVVTPNQIHEFLNSQSCNNSYFDISAKSNYNFDKPFQRLAQQFYQDDNLKFVEPFLVDEFVGMPPFVDSNIEDEAETEAEAEAEADADADADAYSYELSDLTFQLAMAQKDYEMTTDKKEQGLIYDEIKNIEKKKSLLKNENTESLKLKLEPQQMVLLLFFFLNVYLIIYFFLFFLFILNFRKKYFFLVMLVLVKQPI